MFTIKKYVVAESIKEAYELNQKRNNVILGGTGWLFGHEIGRAHV